MRFLLVWPVVTAALVGAGCTTVGDQIEAEENERKEKVDVEIEDCGVVGSHGASGIVKNSSDESYSVYIEIGYFDGDTQVGYDNANFTIPPGKNARFDDMWGSDNGYDDCELVNLSVHDV